LPSAWEYQPIVLQEALRRGVPIVVIRQRNPGARSEELLKEFTTDILRTDGEARVGLFASIGEGWFADEVAIAAALPVPLAILQGEDKQLISVDYLRQLTIPAL
jgi:hypothetical protein